MHVISKTMHQFLLKFCTIFEVGKLFVGFIYSQERISGMNMTLVLIPVPNLNQLFFLHVYVESINVFVFY